jgi:hypothetical protein
MTSINTHVHALGLRLGVVLAAMLALVVLLPAQAWAKTINGTDDDDLIVDTSKDDEIRSKDGDDVIFSGKGEDKIDCGKGHDVVFTDGKDDIASNCEHVKNVDVDD